MTYERPIPCYWRRWSQRTHHSSVPLFCRAVILSLLYIANSAGAVEDVVEDLKCSNNTNLICRDLLDISCEEHCSVGDTFTDSTVLSPHIRNTTQSQPSVIFEVKGGDYKRLRGTGRVHYTRRGYIIGYRECESNPSEVCYIFHNDLPEPFDDWTHDITVNPSSSRPLPLGERCTFFGCLVYCNLVSCQRVYRNFLEENVTIVATCPDLGHSIENGTVSYTRDPTEQGRYVENTTVTVSCDEGYRSSGDIACQNDGNWSSSSLPNCTIVDCGTPPLLLNGETLQFNTTYNSTVTYRCTSSYVFSETSSKNRTCLLSGKWSSEKITCLATCSDLSIEKGKVNPTGDHLDYYVEGTTVTVTCDEGYSGGGDITCQNDGNWSSKQPICTYTKFLE